MSDRPPSPPSDRSDAVPALDGAFVPQQPGAGQGSVGMPPLAGWGWRAVGAVIDMLIIYLPEQAVSKIVGGYTGSLASAVVAFVIAVVLAYMAGTTGQTPGKRVAGTRVLRATDGQVLGFGRAFGRWLLHFLDSFACFIGWLWPLWDEKKQTFADKIVRSVVIKV